jgi:hypothetical protein
MLNQERPRSLRLEIGHEANALIFSNGAKAYSVACQRAEEASSDEIANDWSEVAAAIGRRTRKRPSFYSPTCSTRQARAPAPDAG